ncbi:Fasciclin-like arabinogalactan protein-like protein 1 [Seiridium cupressi]
MLIPNLIPLLAATAAAVSVADVLSTNSNDLSTLTTLLGTVPQLTSALTTASNITVIAPSNAAFQAAMAAMPNLATMVKNTTFLTNLLEYHVVQGVVSSSMFSTTPVFASTALQVPLAAGPSSQMVELLKSNADALVISGLKQVSRVTKADLFFDGGVLHIVDSVLTVPETNLVTALDTGLTSLAGALNKTNMLAGVDALKDATVFAPSNAAFIQVGNVVEAASNELLSNVLEYHIVAGGAVKSTDLMKMASANGGTTKLRTLQGGMLTIRQENGALYINSAEIMVADILTSNGVVHVIDNVMNPLATTALPDTARETQVADFAGASPVSNAPFTSGVSATTTVVPVTVAQAGGHAAMPTAALVGALGAAAAVIANI